MKYQNVDWAEGMKDLKDLICEIKLQHPVCLANSGLNAEPSKHCRASEGPKPSILHEKVWSVVQSRTRCFQSRTNQPMSTAFRIRDWPRPENRRVLLVKKTILNLNEAKVQFSVLANRP